MNERRQGSGQDMPQSNERVDGWLAAARGPALVIAPAEATLIAANPAGATLLGLEENPKQPVALDSAMPAIMDIRRAVNRNAQGRSPLTPLVFWTPEGIARLQCHLEVVETGRGQRLVLVEIACKTAPAMAAPTSKDNSATPLTPVGWAPPRDQPVAQPTAPIGSPPSHPPPDIAPAHTHPPPTRVAHEAAQSPRSALRADDGEDVQGLQAPVFAHAMDNRAKPSPPLRETASRPTPPPQPSAPTPHITTPPPPPPTSPPPTARSDDETLKAIARQILAGRRGAPKGSDSHLHKSTDAPTRPNGIAAPQSRDASSPGHPPPLTRAPPAAGHVNAPASRAAATHRPARDVRRSEPGEESAGSPMPVKPDAIAPAPPAKPAPTGMPPQKVARNAQTVRAEDEANLRAGGIARSTRARRVAHELKTPLSAIASAAEIMKDQRLGSIGDDRYLRYAQDIFESARHALSVIERMLGQTRKDSDESGQAELSFTDLDLNALAAGLLSGLEAMAQEAGLTLASDLSPRLPRVVADATSVRQITLNLLTNALKFTPRGGQVLLITRIDENGRLALSVSDNGPGISAEALAGIADDHDTPSTTGAPQQRAGGGLGIGLPLARALASANGASLAISARDGGGTLVTLTFPSSRQVPI